MAAKTTDMMGVGFAPAQALLMGNDPIAVTCAGTSAGTATAFKGRIANLSAASSQTGAILPAVGSGANLGDVFFIGCTSSTSAVVYPPTNATISGASSVTVAQNKNMIVWYYSPTVLFHIILA